MKMDYPLADLPLMIRGSGQSSTVRTTGSGSGKEHSNKSRSE